MALPKSRKLIKTALLTLHSSQTIHEQLSHATVEQNGVGFNAVDASFGSSLAEQVAAGRSLSPKQLVAAYEILGKYEKQLRNAGVDIDAYEDDPKPHAAQSKGIAALRDDKLCFYPRIKPSTRVKSLGFTWNSEEERWEISEYNYRTVLDLNEQFDLITIDPSLKEWMRENKDGKIDFRKVRRPHDESGHDWEAKPGWVELIDEALWFFPKVYPTSQLKNTGWFYRTAPKHTKKAWTAEAGMENIYQLLEFWPEVNFAPNAKVWIDSYGDIEIIPHLEAIESTKGHNLYPWQVEAASAAVQAKRMLMGLAPGLGKTPTATGASIVSGARRILVVSPKSLLRNWQREIERWDKDGHAEIWHGEYGWYIVPDGSDKARCYAVTNYESLVKFRHNFGDDGEAMKTFMADMEFDTMIVDESSMIKNWRKPKKSRKTGEMVISVQRGQAVIEAAEYVDRLWMLSGGPATKFLDDMWAQFFAIDKKRFSSYWRFAQRYCVVHQDQWGWKIQGNKPNGAGMIKRDYADIYFARTHDQVVDLPGWIFETVEVEMEEEQAQFYGDLEMTMMAEIEGMEDTAMISTANALAQITRLIQAASNPALIKVTREGSDDVMSGPDSSGKWEAIKDLVQYELEAPGIIWVNFVSSAAMIRDYLRDELGLAVEMLTGATKDNDRQRIVDDFQDGKIDWIVAHPGVGKYGFTLTAAKTMLWAERNHHGENYFQGLHRSGKRIGAEHPCHVVHLLSTYPNGAETIDHVIDGVLDYRTETVHKLTAGDIKRILRPNS